MFRRHIPPKKGNLSLYVLLLALAVTSMFMLRKCTSPSIPPRDNQPSGGDTIDVAIEISPMGVTMSGDTLSGEYYNLLSRIAHAHGKTLKFHPFTQLSDALEGIDKGTYRLVVSDIPATAELKQRYIFVNPVGIDRQVLVQRRDSTGKVPFGSQFDLAGQRLYVPYGSPFISRIRNLSHEIGDTIFVEEDPDYSSEQMIMMVATGDLPNVVASESVARALLSGYPVLDASLSISFNQFQGWALAPSDSLLRDTLNSWLSGASSERR